MAGRIMAPTDDYLLIFVVFEYVPLHAKRNFANVIQNFEMGRLPWII